jgi:hypothetical protein
MFTYPGGICSCSGYGYYFLSIIVFETGVFFTCVLIKIFNTSTVVCVVNVVVVVQSGVSM